MGSSQSPKNEAVPAPTPPVLVLGRENGSSCLDDEPYCPSEQMTDSPLQCQSMGPLPDQRNLLYAPSASHGRPVNHQVFSEHAATDVIGPALGSASSGFLNGTFSLECENHSPSHIESWESEGLHAPSSSFDLGAFNSTMQADSLRLGHDPSCFNMPPNLDHSPVTQGLGSWYPAPALGNNSLIRQSIPWPDSQQMAHSTSLPAYPDQTHRNLGHYQSQSLPDRQTSDSIPYICLPSTTNHEARQILTMDREYTRAISPSGYGNFLSPPSPSAFSAGSSGSSEGTPFDMDPLQMSPEGYAEPMDTSMPGGGTLLSSGMTSASPARHVCHHADCGKSYTTKKNLEGHRASVHDKSFPYRCSVCDRPFARQSDCGRHAKRHEPRKPVSCPVCGRQFARRDSFLKHKNGNRCPGDKS